MLVELHAHSSYSDGTSSPAETIRTAAAKKIALFSLTDHDSVEGIKSAGEEAEKLNLSFICGVEVSTDTYDHLHILGYNISTDNKNLLEFLSHYRSRRNERILEIIKKLNSAGVKISKEDLMLRPDCAAGRAHVADALKAKGFAQSRQEAFRKYLVPGAIAYMPPSGAPVREAIAIIKQAGGLPVLAHPGVIMEYLDLPNWVGMRLAGIEVFYPAHSARDIMVFMGLAKKYNLAVTAGSDYHGPRSGREKNMGMEVSEEIFQKIKAGLCR
ncbi:MAG: PHP domain-containing protein [Elusimicrobia bacterium]|nr:PHP domain-containing protein [Elusimicrobiota bacterium]